MQHYSYSPAVKRIMIGLGVVIGIAALVALGSLLALQRSTTPIVFRLDGIESAEIVDTALNRTISPVRDGETVRLSSGSEQFIVRYTGSEGFVDGEQPIDTYQLEQSVSAMFTRARLDEVLKTESTRIRSLIRQKIPNLDEHYSIDTESLYGRGEWYGAILRYKGDAFTNRDDVALVLHKQAGSWVIITNPPLPSVTNIPDVTQQVPPSIRDEINSKL